MTNIYYKGTTLTTEQSLAAKAIIAGESCKLQAPAGSGKTLSLLSGARRLQGYGLNLSFNKSIAVAASKKFPSNIMCKTGHALAFGTVGHKYMHRLQKITGGSLANSFDIGKVSHFRTSANKGYYILDTIRNFCYSSNEKIELLHVPKIKIQIKDSMYKQLVENIKYFSTLVWEEMIDINSNMPITHDVYLKLWALKSPKLNKSFILFDEAQDANPVMLDVITKQKQSQLVFVGDTFQQIYSWRGAVNALQNINLPTYYITKSFRFGQEIADVANTIINSYAAPKTRIPKITGNCNKDSEVITHNNLTPDCIICRTNSGVIFNTMKYLRNDFSIHILGGVFQIIKLIRGIQDLKASDKSYHPELLLFNSYEDLLEYSESPMGGDIRYILNAIKKYGFDKIIDSLNRTEESASEAEITITTVHKAKGLEWPIVKLANDFSYPEIGENIQPEEVNILYVAATRALNTLITHNCDALHPDNLSIGVENWNLMLKHSLI